MGLRRALAAGALLLLALVGMAAPGKAQAQSCPARNPTYAGPCGPEFTVPAWGDAGGWTDPSKYSTIQLADINGDGHDELLARNDQGLEVYWFDTTVGQWRPQVDANGVPQTLPDFRSPLPSEEGGPNWTQPQYYSTIQTADLDGNGQHEIVANGPTGTRVWRYTPPAGSNSINGGTWSLDSTTRNVLPSAPAPSQYLSLHAVDSPGYGFALLTDQSSFWIYEKTAGFFSFPGRPNLAPSSSDPRYYLDNGSGLMPSLRDTSTTPTLVPAYVYRTPDGVAVEQFGIDGMWRQLGPPPTSGSQCQATHSCSPFPDTTCASQASTCFGSTPAFYETMRLANHLLGPGDTSGYVLGRLADGLHVFALKPYTSASGKTYLGWDTSLPVLTDLKDPSNGSAPPGEWSSIRTGDLTGDGHTDVVALVDGQLRAWELTSNASGQLTWSELQPSTPLTLNDEWMTHPEYYSTIQVGDVNGDGSDDVVARGPFGIRTFFYNRRGTGGWERYLPDGYPDFSSRQCPAGVTGPCGQQGAFTTLTKLAKTDGVIAQTASSIRDAWTAENAPQPTDLTSLQRGLISIANCTGAVPGNPPSFQACTPPAGSTSFTSAEWTSVVNEMLAESYNALQVVNLFAQLNSMRQSLFVAQNAALPAIGADLGLQAAADSTSTFSPQSFFAGATGIAASLAGISQPEISAALWVASELISMLPSASQTAMTTFETTYAGLQGKFAQMVGETQKALETQSQTVRQDGGLLSLVGQLRSRGTWALDTIGMTSAANQAFAIWVYKTLMPTVYDRYAITDCFTGFRNSANTCTGVPAGPGVIGGGQNFTTIGQRLDLQAGVPCVQGSVYSECSYATPPADLMNRIWGPVSDTCNYQPGNAGTAWTFGSCSAGVDPRSSIGANNWDFNSYSGDFDVNRPVRLGAQLTAAQDPLPTIVLGRGRIGRRAAIRASAIVTATTVLPPRLRLAGASVRLNRLLFESAGRGELVPRAGRAARPLKLERRASGTFVADAPSHPGVRLALRRARGSSLVTVSLRISTSRLRVPQACVALPAAIAPREPPHFELRTELVINDGHTRRLVRLTHRWSCARDARGNVDRLVSERPHRYPARGGLAVTLHGPRRAQPGTFAHYVAVVHNRRTDRRRLRSSLWDVVLDARRGRVLRLHELRRSRSRRLSFVRRVAPRQRGRFCVDVIATAPGARAVRAQTCTSITNSTPPPVGLG